MVRLGGSSDCVHIGVHLVLGRLQVVLINGVIAREHCYGLMPGNLHRRQGIHTSTPQIGRGGMVEVMKDGIRSVHLLAHPHEHPFDRFHPLAVTSKHIRNALALGH
jgi:hypothetical protein